MDKNNHSNWIKGMISTIILSLLEKNGKMYGYEITQKVKEITQNEIQLTEGALYPALHRLESEGVLSAESVIVEGRVRKYYYITPQGITQTQSKIIELQNFMLHLENIISKPKTI